MQGKNVVVVGGSHGIGLSIVKRCVARGATVTVLSRTTGELVGVDGVNHIAVDVVSDEITAEMLPEQLHGLAYCPGSINLGPLRAVKPDVMRDDFELNVIGLVKCMQAASKALRAAEHSSIVMFSTVAVQTGLAMHTSVAACKGALEALTRTWAAELSPKVRVNCIAPALTDTPLSEKLLSSDEKKKAMAAMYPLGRYGQADDIAAAAEYLLSDTSTWVTGQILAIDGGMSSVRK